MHWPALEPARIAIWGTGREARAAWSALRGEFPHKTLTILCKASEAHDASATTDSATELVAGEIDVATLERFDVVVKSPGISPYSEVVTQATAAGVSFTSGTALWFQAHPRARVIGVTGTKGKSTTAALIAHLLRSAGKRVALAGNIGLPLLELLDPPTPVDWWVLELSSFQTRDMGAVPEIAVLLNLYPEHLDWHGNSERYYDDKLRLLGTRKLRPRVSVLNALQPLPTESLPDRGVVRFGGADGFHVDQNAIRLIDRVVLDLGDLPLPGAHNALNACAALTAVAAAGEDAAALAPALARFRALPHRLQSLGVIDDVEWVNDSISTTPHATLAALTHYRGRAVTVLVGGYDRGIDWMDFRRGIEGEPPFAILTMGQNGPRIQSLLDDLPALRPQRHAMPTLGAAVALARRITPAGGVVLLSPGAPSFGEFRDYVERGKLFAQLAGFDPERIASIEGLGL